MSAKCTLPIVYHNEINSTCVVSGSAHATIDFPVRIKLNCNDTRFIQRSVMACHKCSKILKSQGNLRRHLNTVHKGETELEILKNQVSEMQLTMNYLYTILHPAELKKESIKEEPQSEIEQIPENIQSFLIDDLSGGNKKEEDVMMPPFETFMSELPVLTPQDIQQQVIKSTGSASPDVVGKRVHHQLDQLNEVCNGKITTANKKKRTSLGNLSQFNSRFNKKSAKEDRMRPHFDDIFTP